MRKIVGRISKSDAEKSIELYCNALSLNTLLEIDSPEIDSQEVQKQLKRITNEIDNMWEYIFNEYNIPHYMDYTYGVDHVTSCVFIEV